MMRWSRGTRLLVVAGACLALASPAVADTGATAPVGTTEPATIDPATTDPATTDPVPTPPVTDFEMPFPCGQTWTGTSRPGHSPSPLALDLNRPGDLGDLVTATAPGIVTRVANLGDVSYGRYVVVDHGDGASSLYAHLSAAWVALGQRVDQGTLIGRVGESGNVTGPHLHFEERQDAAVQPVWFHDLLYLTGTPQASQSCPDVPLSGDWDGDGVDEVAVFRRGDGGGTFRLLQDDGTRQAVRFGRGSDVPLAGDWDGDGRADVGVRRPGARSFLLRSGDGTVTALRLGTPAGVPVTGDWDGDGTTDLGLWSARRGRFTLHTLAGDTRVRLGGAGSEPVTGDWNGDGATDLGVYDPSTASFTLRTGAADGSDGLAVTRTVVFGGFSDLPVTGDWNGDGITDVGTWTPATAVYSLRTVTSTGRVTGTVTRFRFGRRR
jgi:hypothetical protein